VGLHEHLDLAAACGALQIAEHVAAGFAPTPGNPVAVAGHVARQIELVAVARAVQALLQPRAAAVDLVVCLAADALDRAIRQCDRASAGPCTVEASERTAGLGMSRRDRHHQSDTDARSPNATHERC